MKISGREIQPLYDAVVESHRDYHNSSGKLNGLIKSYNRLYEMGSTFEGQNFFEDLTKIELMPEYNPTKIDLGEYYEQVSEKFSELEFNLVTLFGRLYGQPINRKTAKEGISVQQDQKVYQKQEVSSALVNNFHQAIDIINSLNITQEAKNEALNNINELEKEIKKEKPSQDVVRRILSWATNFKTLTGANLLPFIVKTILDNWNKIF